MATTHIPYPGVRPRQDGSQSCQLPNGEIELSNRMLHGFQKPKAGGVQSHPLEYSEANWNANKQQMDFAMLRNTQGLHAPLKLQIEQKVTQMNLRLPGLHSSKLMFDTLTGRDELIDFTDILNNPADSEVQINTHAAMDRKPHYHLL